MKNCGSGGYVKSDERSKKEIERLRSTNDALTAALDQSHNSATEGNMPATEYPRLPSRTSFADTPAANKVAAQNVGLQAASAPPPQQQAPMPMQANPQQMNMARSQNPALAFQAAPPDMSALDEAYRRMGQGG